MDSLDSKNSGRGAILNDSGLPPIVDQEEQQQLGDISPLYDQRVQNNEIIKNGGFINIIQHPEFIDEVELYEPINTLKENINEECLRRENKRISLQNQICNRVVYDCSDPSPYEEVKNPTSSYYIPRNQEDTTLVFESRFESGNLKRAIQIFDFEYDLVLRWDYNTKGNMQ